MAPPRLATLLRAALLLGCALSCLTIGNAQQPTGGAPAAVGQGAPVQGAPVQGSAPVPATVPSLAALQHAASFLDRTVVQLRRFRGQDGSVTTVREQLVVKSNGTADPDHALAFLGVEGELPGSVLTQKWQSIYDRLNWLLFEQSTFRIRDAAQAQANYSLHDFGPAVRAGRTVRRLVVFPAAIDKGIWLIDVDSATHLVLYTAEFDRHLRLLSEVEAVSLQLSASALADVAFGSSLVFSGFSAARAALNDPAKVIDPDTMVVGEYALRRVEVRADPLNGQQRLVMFWSDGIDQFFVMQTPGTSNAFGSLPASRDGHTIARYRDAAMTQLFFWDDGVSFEIAGTGSLRRLDELSRRIYRQALAN